MIPGRPCKKFWFSVKSLAFFFSLGCFRIGQKITMNSKERHIDNCFIVSKITINRNFHVTNVRDKNILFNTNTAKPLYGDL